jgi:N-formylglutamate amidohydrolase
MQNHSAKSCLLGFNLKKTCLIIAGGRHSGNRVRAGELPSDVVRTVDAVEKSCGKRSAKREALSRMFSNAILAAWVAHIPHSSTVIPADARTKLLLLDQELALELLRMTDHLTDEVVHSALTKAPRIRFSIRCLVVDPERFPDDANEPLSRVGMGVIYERTSHGLLLRHPPTPSERQNILTTYYVPHHAALESAVATAVDLHGCCTILDVHSFPSRPLPMN